MFIDVAPSNHLLVSQTPSGTNRGLSSWRNPECSILGSRAPDLCRNQRQMPSNPGAAQMVPATPEIASAGLPLFLVAGHCRFLCLPRRCSCCLLKESARACRRSGSPDRFAREAFFRPGHREEQTSSEHL